MVLHCGPVCWCGPPRLPKVTSRYHWPQLRAPLKTPPHHSAGIISAHQGTLDGSPTKRPRGWRVSNVRQTEEKCRQELRGLARCKPPIICQLCAGLTKLGVHFLSNRMGCDRGDSFPFDFEPNRLGKLSPRLYPIQFERKWNTSFLSVQRKCRTLMQMPDDNISHDLLIKNVQWFVYPCGKLRMIGHCLFSK